MEQIKKSNPVMGKVKIITGIIALLVIVFLVVFGSRIFINNKAGFYQVKQAFWVGTMSVRNDPGTYGQNLGDITTYEMVGDIFLSKDEEDSSDGKNDENNIAERVLFPNGYADINFVGMYEIPLVASTQIELHRLYNNDKNLKYMVKQQIIEALKNTGTLMSAEEAYSNKRADFVQLALEQALNGIYKSHVDIDTVAVSGGQTQLVKRYSVERHADGSPVIMKESLLKKYGITLPQFNIKDMDFDPKLVALIDSRKDAQKAEQDAITAKSKGEVLIATEKATQETQKIKEVTIAQKEKEVAELNAEKLFNVAEFSAKQALEEKKALIAKGEGEAAANRLKVAAGLTPQERAEWDYKTATGVAKEIFGGKGIQFPETMIIGGDGKNGTIDPFTAVGLESLKNMANGKK